MIYVGKIYLDDKGGGRLYIPQEMMAKLGWKHHNRIILSERDRKLLVSLENSEESSNSKSFIKEAPVR